MSVNYKHVLAAVDGSDDSEKVARVARNTAAMFDAKLSLLSVVNPLRHLRPGYDATGALEQTVTLEAEIAGARRQRLTALASNLQIDPNHVHVEFGSPATVVHQRAQTAAVDLIVVGTHARHGIGLFLGSTANAVLHGATCNVLVVRLGKSTLDLATTQQRSHTIQPTIEDSP